MEEIDYRKLDKLVNNSRYKLNDIDIDKIYIEVSKELNIPLNEVTKLFNGFHTYIFKYLKEEKFKPIKLGKIGTLYLSKKYGKTTYRR